MKSVVFRIASAAFGIVAVVAFTAPGAHAQGRAFPQGGPKDWSHSHLIASEFGLKGAGSVDVDWRTHAKHVRLEHMRAQRALDNLAQKAPKDPKGPKDSGAEPAEHLDWNLRTGGLGNVVGSPAKVSFDITAYNCSDVIYFTVDQNGAASTPNVIAITNAYAGCPGNAAGATPTVKWGIRMTNGTATSPVPSLDGTVLYVLENRGTGVILHAILVDNITTNPGTYNFGTTNWSNAHVLAAPTGTPTSEQLFEIAFTGVTNNVSSPWLDYTGNQIFFGDSAGRIQHVINTHLSTASRDTTNFTNACGGANQLTSPVFIYGQVIVTSYNGYMYRLDTTGAAPYACNQSAQIGGGFAADGIDGTVSSPIVDVGNDQIIVNTNNYAGFTTAAVVTFDVMFANGAVATGGQALGPETSQAPVTGTFDDAYWSTGTGNYYVVGANGANTNTYVKRFPYNGVLGAVAGFVQLHRSGASAVVATSPITEFLSTGTPNKDEIYVAGGGGTYLFMNRVLAGFAGTDAAPANMANWFATPGGGAISGIIIDTNTAAVTGGTATANIYYGTKFNGATQSTIVQLAQQF